IAKFCAEADIEGKIKNRTLIIPGKVAVLKGEIEDKLPGWNIIVGTNEAIKIPKFLKDLTSST
ncbi:MAG: acetyl-CoA synthase subunit gamma, partial [Oscillospiraceae bacterium]